MRIKYSWVLPVWNEEQSIGLVIAEIGWVMGQKSYEIIVINDGSDDQTKKILKKISNSNLKVVNLLVHQGKWASLSLGFKLAQGKFIITLDSDLQDDPQEVTKLIKKINQGFDIVSGWRKKRDDPVYKVAISNLGNLLTSILSNKVFHDLNSPFKIYRYEVLESLPQLGSMFRFSLLFANNQGYRTIEIPITHRKRLYGKSKFGLRKYFRILYDLILILMLFSSFKSLRTPVKTMMKKLLTYLVVGLSFGFLIWETLRSWSQVPRISWSFNLVNIVILFALFISVQILNIISWHLITKAVGSRISIQKNTKIWTFSTLSRFIPGLIWPFASRVYLATQDGISEKSAILATAIEPILNLFTGLFVLISILIFWQLPIKIEPLFIIVPTVPLVAILILLGNKNALKKIIWLITKNELLAKDLHLSLGWIITLSVVFISHFILAGLALFWLTSTIFPSLTLNLLPILIGIFTLSWLIGYVVIFAPGGLGVMELSLAGLLAFYLPLSLAALVAILFRIFLIAGEGITSVVVFYFFRNE